MKWTIRLNWCGNFVVDVASLLMLSRLDNPANCISNNMLHFSIWNINTTHVRMPEVEAFFLFFLLSFSRPETYNYESNARREPWRDLSELNWSWFCTHSTRSQFHKCTMIWRIFHGVKSKSIQFCNSLRVKKYQKRVENIFLKFFFVHIFFHIYLIFFYNS